MFFSLKILCHISIHGLSILLFLMILSEVIHLFQAASNGIFVAVQRLTVKLYCETYVLHSREMLLQQATALGFYCFGSGFNGEFL